MIMEKDHSSVRTFNDGSLFYRYGIIIIGLYHITRFLFIDSRSNESTKHNIKEFLLTSFVFEMTDTYDSLCLPKFNV